MDRWMDKWTNACRVWRKSTAPDRWAACLNINRPRPPPPKEKGQSYAKGVFFLSQPAEDKNNL